LPKPGAQGRKGKKKKTFGARSDDKGPGLTRGVIVGALQNLESATNETKGWQRGRRDI